MSSTSDALGPTETLRPSYRTIQFCWSSPGGVWEAVHWNRGPDASGSHTVCPGLLCLGSRLETGYHRNHGGLGLIQDGLGGTELHEIARWDYLPSALPTGCGGARCHWSVREPGMSDVFTCETRPGRRSCPSLSGAPRRNHRPSSRRCPVRRRALR